MKNLYSNYYISLTTDGKVIARFTKKEDAFSVLPQQSRCFGPVYREGKVIYIDEKTVLFSSERRTSTVYESAQEYYEAREKKRKMLSDKYKEEMENER